MEGKKRALLQEFDSRIGPKKLELAGKLPLIWKYYSTSSLGSGSRHAGKRSAAVLEKPLTAEQLQQLEGLMAKCEKLLSKIFGLKNSQWFRQPVDLKAVPTYLNFVARAMDLGTIRSNLKKNAYKTPMDFYEDLHQVWENCAAYNGLGTPCRSDGDICRQYFLSSWKDMKIEDEWKKLQIEIDPSGAPLQDRITILNTQLGKIVNTIPASNQPPGPGRDMTFVEKRKLSTQLSRLQAVPDLLKGVLDIVSSDPLVSSCSEGELEVELDQLQPETLWKLQALVASKPAPAGQSKPAPTIAPPSKVQAAEKKPPASVQSSGAGSDSDSGEHSPNGVKGSTLDDPLQGVSLFAKDRKNMVDESATNPQEPSLFVKDRVAAHKPDVNINSANWQSLSEAPTDAGTSEGGAQADGGDEMWKSFKSIAEQKQQREEEQRKEAEKMEIQKREEQEKAKLEEEERAKKLKEEEERLQADMQRQREEQKEKELAEIQAKAGTANLTQQTDMGILSSMPLPAEGLAAVGLEIRADDEDMAFDEED